MNLVEKVDILFSKQATIFWRILIFFPLQKEEKSIVCRWLYCA